MNGTEMVDIASFGGILVITTVAVQFLRNYIGWIAAEGKNTRLAAVIIAVGLTAISKWLGYGFADIGWFPAILTGFGTAATAMFGTDTTKRVVKK